MKNIIAALAALGTVAATLGAAAYYLYKKDKELSEYEDLLYTDEMDRFADEAAELGEVVEDAARELANTIENATEEVADAVADAAEQVKEALEALDEE